VALPQVPPDRTSSSPRFFSPTERAQVEVLLEAIWPGGPANPGARDARAADYVDFLLGQPESSYYEIARWQKQYSTGLAALHAATSTGPLKKPLATLTVDEATSLLADLAAGKVPTFSDEPSQRDFFAVLRAHCIEGCLGDPRWTGSDRQVVWRWLGYPGGGAQDFSR
jgi:hypothetical protein